MLSEALRKCSTMACRLPRGTRKLLGVSAESQRFLINFEPVMGEHSAAALQLEEVSDKVSDKGRPKGSAKCSNFRAGWSEHRERRPGKRAVDLFARPEGPEPSTHS